MFGNRLTASAKRPSANGLRCNTLLSNLPLTSNVRQCLLNRGILVRVHKCADIPRRVPAGGAAQCRNALPRCACSQSPCFLKRLCRLRSNAAGVLNGSRLICGCTRRHIGCALTGDCGDIPGSAHNVPNAAKRLLIHADAACRRLLCRGPRSFVTHANAEGRVCCTQTSPKTRLRRGFGTAKTRCTHGLCASGLLNTSRVNCGLCSKPRLCGLLRCRLARLLQARNNARRRFQRPLAASGCQVCCGLTRCGHALLARRSLCPCRVNCRLSSGSRGLRSLNRPLTRSAECSASTLHRTAGRVDRSGGVDRPLLCRGPRTGARGCRLLSG